MHILVTNDDGVYAPGILALAQEMRGLWNVTLLAPDRNWSASGHVKTLDRPLRVKEVKLADDIGHFTLLFPRPHADILLFPGRQYHFLIFQQKSIGLI